MWQLFLSALFGLLAGLVGTGFQAHLQKKEKEEERQERRKEIRREKAELVFNELSALIKAYSDLSVDSLRYAAGKEVTLTPASNARISALILVYFPECVPLLDQFDKDMMTIVEKVSGELRKDDAYKDPDKIKGIMVLMHFQSSQRARKLSDDLRPLLRDEIQRLW